MASHDRHSRAETSGRRELVDDDRFSYWFTLERDDSRRVRTYARRSENSWRRRRGSVLEPFDRNRSPRSCRVGRHTRLCARGARMRGGGKHRRPDDLRGIPPGQLAGRGSGTRFCVSGPFPDELIAGQLTTIEQIINGVVIAFQGVDGNHHGIDVGVWDNAARIIPLCP
jgi:hypothetical protein